MDINLLAENLAATSSQNTASKPAAKTVRKISKIEKKPPAFIKRKRVAAYCRVSKDTGDMRHSLSAQVSHYNSYIQSNPEWACAGIFADLGITGTSTDRHREFNRLIKECDEGNVDIVLCKSVSRFARNTVDTLETVRHLRSIGVEVRFERENLSCVCFNTGGDRAQEEGAGDEVQREDGFLFEDHLPALRHILWLKDAPLHGQVPQDHLALHPPVQMRGRRQRKVPVPHGFGGRSEAEIPDGFGDTGGRKGRAACKP